MRFVKMHGIGNDYVYIDAYTDPSIESRPDLPDLARRISDRHRGVGGDGLILVCRPTNPDAAHARMRMFNADGSEAEMCGNGVRCVAKFAHDRLGVQARPMRVETGRGALEIDHRTQNGRLVEATVDMGEPILDPERIPVDLAATTPGDREHEHRVAVNDNTYRCLFVSMGNPHAVTFVDDVAAVDLPRLGSAFERHGAFPRRVNVHVVQIASPGEATMRTWERGTGITQACGTGACAVLVAGVLAGLLEPEALIHLPGGDLTIRWDRAESGHVFMTGPAEEVFEGEWNPR